MKDKINVAKLLEDCPKGMELNCTMFENLEFDHINKNNGAYPIICRVKTEWGSYNVHTFTEYGCYQTEKYSKCAIFPKGKTTWEGFHRPFKDGDICYIKTKGFEHIFIFKGIKDAYFIQRYANLSVNRLNTDEALVCGIDNVREFRLATEEEKQKLFQAIKDNGYKWNPYTKTLEKLVVPKFKVGDSIIEKNNKYATFTISDIDDSRYYCGEYVICNICYQDNWELVPNKFDITTLKPFDKVLVSHKKGEWHIQFFEKYSPTSKFPFICIGGSAYQKCIPYENNKHLLGTTNDCDDFYKTWK